MAAGAALPPRPPPDDDDDGAALLGDDATAVDVASVEARVAAEVCVRVGDERRGGRVG